MKIRKKYLFYALAFSSAILISIVTTIDATISALFIPNAWAFALANFLVGIPISLLLISILSLKVKGKSLGARYIDPSFTRLRLIRKEEISYQLVAGVGNAILTIGFLTLMSMMGDPSTVLPFSQIAILYIVLIESVVEKNIPTLPEVQSAMIVTFGALLGSISLTGTITLESMLIVFLVVNPAWMLFSIYQRKLKRLKIDRRSNDAMNIRFWNVLFSCIIIIGISILFDALMGTTHLIEGFQEAFAHVNIVSLSMGITFFSYVFYIRALGIGKASVTQAVRSSTILFTIPLSLLLSYFAIAPAVSADPVMILLKIIGTVLIVLGIVSYAITQVKAYIFIHMKPGYSIDDIMQNLWNINGVARVTAVSGPYDFIVKIQTRTLVRGYEKIIRSIEEIKGIKDYKWESVLKEWEDI